jgi:transposase
MVRQYRPQGIAGYKKPPRVSAKSESLRLRTQGHTYAAIAHSLGLSVNTVKSWCLRAGMAKSKTHEPCVIPRKIIDPEEWRQRLHALARARGDRPKRPQRVILVCGMTKISGGADFLCAVVEYRLKMDPYNGDVYAFIDWGHKRVKWISWDGSAFCVGHRRMEYGVYPWPSTKMGKTIELSEEEFSFLLSGTAPEKRAKKQDFS